MKLIFKIYSIAGMNLASFYKRYDKNILMCFRFTVPAVVHLQNASAKFHNVV